MHIRVSLKWGETSLYQDYFLWCVCCTVVVLTCFVVCGYVRV